MANQPVTQGTKHLSKKEYRERKRRIWSPDPGSDVVHPHAAGIDVGGSEHYVALAPSPDSDAVRCFGCFTTELQSLSQYLKEHGVRTVAMQATGVYWIPLFDVLEETASKCTWSMPAIPRTCRAARATCKSASGCSNCILTVYCAIRSTPLPRSGSSAVCGGSAPTGCRPPPIVSIACKKRSRR